MKRYIIYLIPFLLPFVMYGIYVLLARAGIVKGGSPAPWAKLLAAGLVLCLLTVGIYALTDGAEPGGEYVPPRVEDGKIVPGGFRESE